MAEKIGLAVLLSGGGTTLANIIEHIRGGKLDAEVRVVVSSRADAYGLVRAEEAGIDGFCVERKAHDSLEGFNAAIRKILDRYEIDLVVLAGFMSLFIPGERYADCTMNIHPALIPSFCGKGYYGMRVHEAVLEYGAKVSGATVQFIDAEYDTGPIILQKCVPVLDDDTPQSLAERVHVVEREIYPTAIQLYAEGRLKRKGRRVKILPAKETNARE